MAIKLQNAYDRDYDEKSGKLYLRYREEIETLTLIKEKISEAIYHRYPFLIYFNNCRYPESTVRAFTMNYPRYILPLKFCQKLFETTDYGDKILMDLLKEKLPPPFRIEMMDSTVTIRWSSPVEASISSGEPPCIIL